MAQEMRLQRLKLKHFKGVREFEFEPAGADATVFGANAAGKTSIADAWAWLMFGKDSGGSAQFEIKTLDGNGEALHGLDHEVEAEVVLPDGKKRTLRKVYHEKWTKRRGEARSQLTRNTTDHFIDGVPATKGEYDATIEGIASEDAFRLLADPYEFAERMHWQDRRRLLLEVCGDVSDAEVIAADKALADLDGILNGRSLDDHRKVIQARRTEINKELERIPVRIDEQTRALPETGEGDEDAIRSRLAEVRAERAEAQEAISRVQSGGEVSELTKRLREIEGDMQAAENRIRAGSDEQAGEIRKALAGAKAEVDAATRAVAQAAAKVTDADAESERIDKKLHGLRADWTKADAHQFRHDAPDTCAACGQSLPEEKVKAAREVALADFNLRKARKLEEIDEDGKRLRHRLEEIKGGAASRSKKLESAKDSLAAREKEVAQLQELLDAARTAAPDALTDTEFRKLAESHAGVEKEIASLRESTVEAVAAAREKVADLDRRVVGLETDLSRFDQRRRGEERIEELSREERSMAGEFEELERQLYLTDLFVRTKVRLLEKRINSRFQLARFRLFRELVNGGIEECCEVTFKGSGGALVPWSSLNTGAQINVGLDIVNTLAEHFGVAPPVFCDHAESVTDILPTVGQQIRLVVSEGDIELRVETTAEQLEAVAAS